MKNFLKLTRFSNKTLNEYDGNHFDIILFLNNWPTNMFVLFYNIYNIIYLH